MEPGREAPSSALQWLLFKAETLEKQLAELVKKVEKLETSVNGMAKREEIAQAVKLHNRLYLTRAQRLGGVLLIVISAVDFVRGFTG